MVSWRFCRHAGGNSRGRDEDNNDEEQMGKTGSSKKMKLSREEVRLLEEAFTQHERPTVKQREEIALRLNVQLRQVEVWFQVRGCHV